MMDSFNNFIKFYFYNLTYENNIIYNHNQHFKYYLC